MESSDGLIRSERTSKCSDTGASASPGQLADVCRDTSTYSAGGEKGLLIWPHLLSSNLDEPPGNEMRSLVDHREFSSEEDLVSSSDLGAYFITVP